MTAPVIALVDDDRNILTSVSIALQAEGFVTRLYPDGTSALKALGDNPADLGVFDIKMPGMDGLALLSALRAGGGASAPAKLPASSLPRPRHQHLLSTRGISTARACDGGCPSPAPAPSRRA